MYLLECVCRIQQRCDYTFQVKLIIVISIYDLIVLYEYVIYIAKTFCVGSSLPPSKICIITIYLIFSLSKMTGLIIQRQTMFTLQHLHQKQVKKSYTKSTEVSVSLCFDGFEDTIYCLSSKKEHRTQFPRFCAEVQVDQIGLCDGK